jgi:hypothetical protein
VRQLRNASSGAHLDVRTRRYIYRQRFRSPGVSSDGRRFSKLAKSAEKRGELKPGHGFCLGFEGDRRAGRAFLAIAHWTKRSFQPTTVCGTAPTCPRRKPCTNGALHGRIVSKRAAAIGVAAIFLNMASGGNQSVRDFLWCRSVVRVRYGNHVVVAGVPNGHAVAPLPFFILVGSAAILDQAR